MKNNVSWILNPPKNVEGGPASPLSLLRHWKAIDDSSEKFLFNHQYLSEARVGKPGVRRNLGSRLRGCEAREAIC